MITPLTLLITALAVMRVTRLVTTDKITNPLRMKIINRSGENGWFTFLFHCPICFSVWIAAAASPLYWYFGSSPWFLIPAMALAFAQLVIFVNRMDAL